MGCKKCGSKTKNRLRRASIVSASEYDITVYFTQTVTVQIDGQEVTYQTSQIVALPMDVAAQLQDVITFNYATKDERLLFDMLYPGII